MMLVQPAFALAVVALTIIGGTASFKLPLDRSGSVARSPSKKSKTIIWSGKLPLVTSPSVPLFLLHLLKHKLQYEQIVKIPTMATPLPSCICVPYYMCDSNNTIITDGATLIDVRYRRCTGDLEVCCYLPNTTAPSPDPIPTAIPTFPPTMMTMLPTMPPTMLPTIPTAPPTMLPTIPTAPPTILPTIPTAPPTMLPTIPTMPPTIPTMSPTMSTMPPTMSSTQPMTAAPITFPPTALPTSNCICVPFSQCDANRVIIVSGEGIIDPRQQFGTCPIAGQVCCRLPSSVVDFPTNSPITIPSLSPTQLPMIMPNPGQQVCVCVKTWQCDATGFIIVSGAGNIDPRFPIGRQGQVGGSCGAADEVCCRISASGGGNLVYCSPLYLTPTNPNGLGPITNPGSTENCVCVKTWQCSEGNAVSQDGAGIIDPRFGICRAADEICCRQQGIVGLASATRSSNAVQAVVVNGNPASAAGMCGIRGTAYSSAQTVRNDAGATYFAEFPWMVALLVQQNSGAVLFQCGASLLNTMAVLTAAHCVISRDPSTFVVRVGEWDTRNNNEPVAFQEVKVQTMVTHPQFYSGGLYHDVAVIILATPVKYAVNVMPICLPQQGMTFAPGTRCYATGWGRNAFGTEGQYQAVLRQVDLPVIEQSECQRRLRQTRLGQYFELHGSFMCAGGEDKKDTCRGDGGGPLVCPTSSGQYIQAGVVSWGIGCGASTTPAVYASVSQHRQWIDRQLANYGAL